MISLIPTLIDTAHWTQRTELDGTSYLLDFRWNGRESAWYLSVSAIDGTPLLLSRKLSTNWPVLARFRNVPGLPPGELIPADPSGQIPYAGYQDLGRGVNLYYFDASEGLA